MTHGIFPTIVYIQIISQFQWVSADSAVWQIPENDVI
jgi:hypothetical protein